MIRHYIVKRHRSARSLAKKAMEEELRKMGESEARMPAHPSAPEDGEFTFRDLVASVREQGMWAFVRFYGPRQPAELHWWADGDVSAEDLAGMIGHELGHLSDGTHDDDVLEEKRADNYGEVARETVAFLKRLEHNRKSSGGARSSRVASRGQRSRRNR